MKRFSHLLTVGCVLVTACGSFSVLADDVQVARAASDVKAERSTDAANSAVIYWQAFAAIPTLTGDDKKTLDAATTTTTAPFKDDVKPIVERYRTALHELHRARAVAPCDWNLDIDAGPELQLPHLQKARELSRVALLQARMRFAAGENAEALDSVLDVFKLGRDCGCQPILIAYLVNIAIEKMATDVLAAHLPLLKPEQLESVAKALKELPPTSSATACIQFEEKLFGDWLERAVEGKAKLLTDPNDGGKLLEMISKQVGVEFGATSKPTDAEAKRKARLLETLTIDDVRASMKRMRADYRELAVIGALPFAEQATRLKKFEDELAATKQLKTREDVHRIFSSMLLPAVSMVLLREEQFMARRGLLEQALNVQHHGPEALQPVRAQKVEHKKTATGFELHCPVGSGKEVLIIGQAS